MSESTAPTFSQVANPTQGLQAYDLDRKVGNFVPLPSGRAAHLTTGTARRSLRMSGRPDQSRPSRVKDKTMDDRFKTMLAHLRTAVTGIAKQAPADAEELLAKSVDEFGAVLEGELEQVGADFDEALAKNAPEEPLFKGLGCVGRVADMMRDLARTVARIKDGKDYSSDTPSDPASDEVASMCDHLVAMGELVLRAAVNEHVEIADPDEEVDDDLNYVSVPSSEDPENAAIVLKGDLPDELMKFATDAGALDAEAIYLGSTLLLAAGTPEASLAKMFDDEGEDVLGKAEGDLPPGADQGADPNADQGADMGGTDLGSQLEVLGRLLAAGLMQLEHAVQTFEGGDTAGMADPTMGAAAGADPTGGADAGAAAGAGADATAQAGGTDAAGGATPPEPPKKDKEEVEKAAGTDTLAKAEVDAEMLKAAGMITELRAQLAEREAAIGDATRAIQELRAAPATPKGVANTAVLSKSADTAAPAAAQAGVLTEIATLYKRATNDQRRRELLLKANMKQRGVTEEELLKHAA